MGSTERAKNTASSKDLCKVFRGYSLVLDASKWRDDTEVLVERHEVLLQDIFAETPRPTEVVLQQALVLAYSVSRNIARDVASSINLCVKLIREKGQSATSGRKLSPAMWRLVQRLRESSMTGSPSERKQQSRASQATTSLGSKNSKPGNATSPSSASKATPAAILAMYGVTDDDVESEPKAPQDALSISSDDVPVKTELFADDAVDETALEVPGSGSDLMPVGKPFFDPSRGVFLQILSDGSQQEGQMTPGAHGFCMVSFPESTPFESQVPNLFLEAPAPKSAVRFQTPAATKSSRRKPKGKAKATAAPAEALENVGDAEEDAEKTGSLQGSDASATEVEGLAEAVGDDEAASDDEAPRSPVAVMLGEAARSSEAAEPSKAELWNGYSLLDMPTAAMPPSDAKGQHSYTVRLNDSELDVDISIDVLMRCRAFFVKKPTEKKLQFTWGKYGSIAEAWEACLNHARSSKRPRVLK